MPSNSSPSPAPSDPHLRYAQLYDSFVPDWPGEVDFYRRLAAQVKAAGHSVLEVACGTGRISLRLAENGASLIAIDHSPEMLSVARAKSIDPNNPRWLKADMRSFDLSTLLRPNETIELVLVTGHAFQYMLTPADQLACLERISACLAPGGLLVIHLDHQDVTWLGDLRGDLAGMYEPGEVFVDPLSGHHVQPTRAWAYEPSTQTAAVHTHWYEYDADNKLVTQWETGPVHLHCVFRFEMEHLLARAGYQIEEVYGDFYANPLHDDSTEMIWLARR